MNIVGPQFALRQCEGHIDANQTVDVDDLLIVINNWGTCGSMTCAGDLNCNGVVDVDDLLIVINSWGDCALPSLQENANRNSSSESSSESQPVIAEQLLETLESYGVSESVIDSIKNLIGE